MTETPVSQPRRYPPRRSPRPKNRPAGWSAGRPAQIWYFIHHPAIMNIRHIRPAQFFLQPRWKKIILFATRRKFQNPLFTPPKNLIYFKPAELPDHHPDYFPRIIIGNPFSSLIGWRDVMHCVREAMLFTLDPDSPITLRNQALILTEWKRRGGGGKSQV